MPNLTGSQQENLTSLIDSLKDIPTATGDGQPTRWDQLVSGINNTITQVTSGIFPSNELKLQTTIN